jgi:hypothetical protein
MILIIGFIILTLATMVGAFWLLLGAGCILLVSVEYCYVQGKNKNWICRVEYY